MKASNREERRKAMKSKGLSKVEMSKLAKGCFGGSKRSKS